jgi:hypothetical protein
MGNPITSTCVKRWSANRKNINPSTGTEYSEDLRFEFARNWSADSQSFFSISVWLAGIYKRIPSIQYFAHIEKYRKVSKSIENFRKV